MSTERIIVCGALKVTKEPDAAFNLWKKAGPVNVSLDILDLNERFYRAVPRQFQDLLEIATYVYTADQMFTRDAWEVQTFGANWRRRLHFHIPVRVPELWNSPQVSSLLRDALEFLSDDYFEFTFHPTIGGSAPEIQEYLHFSESGPGSTPEGILMFSGGLDSLAGAIQEILQDHRRVALVNHRSTEKFHRTHLELEKRLRGKAGAFQPMLLRVEINKKGIESKDHYQRVRSFLFTALGGTVARTLGLNRLRFYENGVLSLNLPIAAQVVGSRSTRTTHPRVLKRFEELLTLLSGEQFTLENPFLRLTKGDVVKRIVEAKCEDLIMYSRSCAHTWQSSNARPQCGVCSQCLDRRLAMLAAGAEQFDTLDRYERDIFAEERPKNEDKLLGAGFLERANIVASMRDSGDFLLRYPELLKALPFMGADQAAALEQAFGLYRRHADEVKKALKCLTWIHAERLIEHGLPPQSLIRAVFESESPTTTPMEADREPAERRITLGRIKYMPDFQTVWLDNGGALDLSKWDKARACLKYLVGRKAYSPDLSAHLDEEIDPFVRTECGLEPAPNSEPKIHHYFNDKDGPLRSFCRDVIVPTGSRRYYLKKD